MFRAFQYFWSLLFLLLASAAFASPLLDRLPQQPLIPPGYAPSPSDAKDLRGLWMEMTEAEKTLRRSPLIVDDESLNAYVKGVACRVVHNYCDDLRVYVVRNPSFNASIAPNGLMLVHTGLLIRMNSSDQLASVLSHEFVHYAQTHSLQLLRKAKRNFAIGTFVSLFGVPAIFAFTSVLKFNRDQETDADELGAYYAAAAGYAPEAGSTIWHLLEEEEDNASAKRPKGPQFLSSHPKSKARAAKLAAVAERITSEANQLNVEQRSTSHADPLLGVLQKHYSLLMDEQVQQRDAGRLLTLLERHEALGIRPADVAFYRGEAYRVRGGVNDAKLAIAAYRRAIEAENNNPNALRELGYLEYKHGSKETAEGYFRAFLDLVPNASDREMIELYLEGGW
jgi:predicted Zn-dependent protease